MTIIPNVCGLVTWPAMALSVLIICAVLLVPRVSARGRRLLAGPRQGEQQRVLLPAGP